MSDDIRNEKTGERWVYSPTVKDHFFHPRNLLLDDPAAGKFDATGVVGSPACGDVMHVWLKIDKATERVTDMKWKTFGCGSAIAATSMFSVMVTENGGMLLAEAVQLRPQDVMKRLGGLPNRKIHCSVLVDKAFRKAANDWFRANGQVDRIQVDGARVVDPATGVTDKDIEEAVLEGAVTLEDVQKKLKAGVGAAEDVRIDVEQLIRFYKDKYYG